MTTPRSRRSLYRVTRRVVALHRRHVNAAYPACVLCIIDAAPAR